MYSSIDCSFRSESLLFPKSRAASYGQEASIGRDDGHGDEIISASLWLVVCIRVRRAVSYRREEALAVRGVGKEYMSKRQGYLVLPPLHLTLHLTLHAVAHHPVRVVVLVTTISPGNLLDGLGADALGCRHRAIFVGEQ